MWLAQKFKTRTALLAGLIVVSLCLLLVFQSDLSQFKAKPVSVAPKPIPVTRPSRPPWLYDIGVLAVFRGESIHLKEWLEYHLLIGVQHFWLVSNDCEDQTDSNSVLRCVALLCALVCVQCMCVMLLCVEGPVSCVYRRPYVDGLLVSLDRRFLCASKFQREAYNTLGEEIRVGRLAKW